MEHIISQMFSVKFCYQIYGNNGFADVSRIFGILGSHNPQAVLFQNFSQPTGRTLPELMETLENTGKTNVFDGFCHHLFSTSLAFWTLTTDVFNDVLAF